MGVNQVIIKTTFLSLLFVTLNCFTQNDSVFIRKNSKPNAEKPLYKTDTIIFKTPNARNILIGNAILTQTTNQQLTKSYGLFFTEFDVKECRDSQDEPKPNRFLEIKQNSKEWTIKALVYTNCCQDFLADVSVENDDTLNLMFINYAMYCFCSCPFEISYRFKAMSFNSLKDIKFVSINGKSKRKLDELIAPN